MGRKKIKIQPIKDDRNRQVKEGDNKISVFFVKFFFFFWGKKGHLFKKKTWIDEEGVRIISAL